MIGLGGAVDRRGELHVVMRGWAKADARFQQLSTQEARAVVPRLARSADHPRHPDVAVDHAGFVDVLDAHAGSAEGGSIGGPL